jgi:hypothetical protein
MGAGLPIEGVRRPGGSLDDGFDALSVTTKAALKQCPWDHNAADLGWSTECYETTGHPIA